MLLQNQNRATKGGNNDKEESCEVYPALVSSSAHNLRLCFSSAGSSRRWSRTGVSGLLVFHWRGLRQQLLLQSGDGNVLLSAIRFLISSKPMGKGLLRPQGLDLERIRRKKTVGENQN
jgi:hypothetical protein